MLNKKLYFIFIVGLMIAGLFIMNSADVSSVCYGHPVWMATKYILSEKKDNCVYTINYGGNVANIIYFSITKSAYISLLNSKIGFFAGLNKATYTLILQLIALYKLGAIKYLRPTILKN